MSPSVLSLFLRDVKLERELKFLVFEELAPLVDATYTLNKTNTTIVQIPNNVSWYRIWSRFLKIAIKESRKLSALPGMPSSDLNWEDAMLIAAADVKPVITGSDIKSNKKPWKKQKGCIYAAAIISLL